MIALETLNNTFFEVTYLGQETLGITLTIRSLEVSNGQMVKAHIVQLLEVHKLKNVMIDLANVKTIDSFGLASVISVFKFCNKLGGNIILLQPTSIVLQLFEVTRISKMVHIFDTLQEGRDFFNIQD